MHQLDVAHICNASLWVTLAAESCAEAHLKHCSVELGYSFCRFNMTRQQQALKRSFVIACAVAEFLCNAEVLSPTIWGSRWWDWTSNSALNWVPFSFVSTCCSYLCKAWKSGNNSLTGPGVLDILSSWSMWTFKSQDVTLWILAYLLIDKCRRANRHTAELSIVCSFRMTESLTSWLRTLLRQIPVGLPCWARRLLHLSSTRTDWRVVHKT